VGVVRLRAMGKHLTAPPDRDDGVAGLVVTRGGGGERWRVRRRTTAASPTSAPPATSDGEPETGPHDSFEDFYREHADTLRRALCLALGDADLGTEAADEAMTRACERWSEVARYDNRVGWAYRVGLNWARSRQRRNRWRDHRPVPEHGELAVPGDPELATALAGLTTDHRTDETAAALDVPAGTVKSRLNRALSSLQRTLEDPR
jgi:DNA-directed RNA polymerase specialized sigma24 family protein